LLFLLFRVSDGMIFACSGALIALFSTFLLLRFEVSLLPVDHGRAFAVEGGQSKGKPTGAGLLFITVFVLSAFLFIPIRWENILFYVFIEAAMIAGYLDDGANKPWSEYKKGILDLLISFMTAFTYASFSTREIIMPIIGHTVTLPFLLYLFLGTLLVWVAINVTNCTDGVDGLSSSLTIISLISILLLSVLLGTEGSWSYVILIMIAVLFAYLWYNTNPSQLLMGDAGSRALGVFLAISIMQTHQPFAYLILCLVFILDGGAGIAKISLKRFLHISILKNTITPFHDHLRKKVGWTNSLVTIRMAMIHAVICGLYLFIIYCFLKR
jgi:phospho-N-acetylmuramoyl-pentapeptide-transferase